MHLHLAQARSASPSDLPIDPRGDDSLTQPLARAVDVVVTWLEAFGLRTLFIVLIALALYLATARGLRLLGRRSRISESDVATLRIVARWGFVLLTGAALLQSWQVLENVWAAATAVIALIAIGFVAVWSVLSNVMCSFILLGVRPFRIGETVSIVGEEVRGRVEQITLLFTMLRAEDGSQVLIPNNQMFQKSIRRELPGPKPTEGEKHEDGGGV